ncbi:MAG: aminomethyl transferase family protein [Nitrospirae bacterium]|nr:aminomethyl transferase family protein [Nitrospirota bacterium]
MNKTRLFEIQKAAGAVFEPSDERELVRSYGNTVAEHLTVRKKAGLIDRSHRGKLRLKGKDRTEFLHGMVTNDIQKLAPGNGLYAVFTTDKAKMLADGRVYCLPDALWIDLEPEATGKIYKHLDKYTLASDVTVENLTETQGLLSIYGPSSSGIISQIVPSASMPPNEYSTSSLSLDGTALLMARNEITGEVGYDLYLPADKLASTWNRLLQIGDPHGLQPVGLEALNSLRIEAGIPNYGIDMDESNFPMEAGLEARAISYTKGCYIGQETIARADAQGQMNKRLMGLELAGESVPKKGQSIQARPESSGAEGRLVGTITSAVKSPTFEKVIAMGYLHRDFIKPGTEVFIAGQSAKVISLPFYTRSGQSKTSSGA